MHLYDISILFIFLSTVFALPSHDKQVDTNQLVHIFSFPINVKRVYNPDYSPFRPPPTNLQKLPMQAANPRLVEVLWEKYRKTSSVAGKQVYPLTVPVNGKQVVIKGISDIKNVVYEIHGYNRLGMLVAWAESETRNVPKYLVVLECAGCVPASKTHLSSGQFKTLREFAKAEILMDNKLSVGNEVDSYACQPVYDRDEHAIGGYRARYVGGLNRKSYVQSY